MNQFQLHHFDMPTALGLTPAQWGGWCMQWHMYKRDFELTRTHQLVPNAGCRYEVVCVYLETLLPLEVTDGGNIKKKVQVSPNPYFARIVSSDTSTRQASLMQQQPDGLNVPIVLQASTSSF